MPGSRRRDPSSLTVIELSNCSGVNTRKAMSRVCAANRATSRTSSSVTNGVSLTALVSCVSVKSLVSSVLNVIGVWPTFASNRV